ncbi:AP-3 complex subunit beta [Spathaspora sp. JA1]|nr:AP-3 complex subunit beta [Spathaspora sp. JA1]
MADSFAKLSSMIESAKELTIEAAVSASARLTDTPSALRPQEISNLLNSRTDREILNGMKCVISLISRGEDGLPYFADVVKNVTNSNVKVRQLVLIYLTKYAEAEPDTALLSVNSIQRSLNEKNPVSRANSIRSLAGIRISSIIPIFILCIKRTSKDHSPLVRSATAISIGKAYAISGHSKKQLIEHLTDLLADSDASVVSSAIKTYCRIRTDLTSESKFWAPIHGNFRRFCKMLPKFDEWTQSIVIDLLTDYSRKFFHRPKLYSKDSSNQIMDLPDDITQIPFEDYDVSFDEDLQLFLDSMKSLTYSSSENVILSIAKSVYLLAPPTTFQDFHLDKILVRIATVYDESQVSLFALQTIVLLSEKSKMFSSFFKKFYVMPSDSNKVSVSKLIILSSIATEENFKYILEELKYYALHSPSDEVKKESIRAIGKCSQISPSWNNTILKWSMARIKDSNGGTLNELLKVIRYLIQQRNESKNNEDKEVVLKTSYRMGLILQDKSIDIEDEAKASIIWMIGEYSDLENGSEFASDILRVLLKSFVNESESVRYQILVLACKIFSYELLKLKNESGDNNQDYVNEQLSNSIEYKMFQHALQLAKYDTSYDIRDRARMFNVLLNTGTKQAQLACLFLQVPKSVPFITTGGTRSDDILSANLHDYFTVTEWTLDQTLIPPASIRNEVPVKMIQNPAFFSSSNDSRKKSPSPVSVNAISSEQFANSNSRVVTSVPKTEYQLQSLDEFFGSDESSGEELDEGSEESEEESEEEGEEDSEEEESDDEELASDEEEELKPKRQGKSTLETSNNIAVEENSDESSSSDADSTKGFI